MVHEDRVLVPLRAVRFSSLRDATFEVVTRFGLLFGCRLHVCYNDDLCALPSFPRPSSLNVGHVCLIAQPVLVCSRSAMYIVAMLLYHLDLY